MYTIQRIARFFALAGLLGFALPSDAQIEAVFRAGFEDAVATNGPPLLDVVLDPGASTSLPGAEGVTTISATGTCATHVVARNGVTEYGQAVSVIDLQGCAADISMQPTASKAGKVLGFGSGPAACGIEPEDEAGYAVLDCWRTFEAEFARAEFNAEFIGYGRVPYEENQVVWGIAFTVSEPDTVGLLRRYAHKELIASALLGCSHADCSQSNGAVQVRGNDAVPVLLIHGYQPEPLGPLGDMPIRSNGGKAYFNELPDRLVSNGYFPFEFRWVSNARFHLISAIRQPDRKGWRGAPFLSSVWRG